MSDELAPFQRIAADLRARIAAGELRPGDRIPSARALTRQWSVAIATASRALAALQAEGLTRVVPGVGTVVAGPPAMAPATAPAASSGRRSRRVSDAASSREQQGGDLRGEIVRHAVGIADAEGLAEVSMRRLASELGVATMSLYRTLGGKDELLVQMIDAALGELSLPDTVDGDWRAQLEAVSRALWQVFRRHPWLAGAMSMTRPQLAPSAIVLANRVLGILEPIDLDSQTRLYAYLSLFTFVRGAASALEPEALAHQETGLTSDEWMASQQEAFAVAVAPDSPLARLTAEDLDMELDELFEFGLARLLDGLVDLTSRPRG